MATLSLHNLQKTYGNFTAVNGVSLEVGQAEFIALLGPSGCGKTTMLRMIAGFIEPTAGRIVIGEHDVTAQPPHRRNTGMVFQSYALFPHMTVAENVSFGLRMRRLGGAAIQARSLEALRLVQLDHLAARYPRELSGGQQQRVAVARALVIQPDVFLLDEPLSNLDAKLRQSVGMEMRALQRNLGLTTVFVTHDQNEALALADLLVLMNAGNIEQSGTAAELYNRPASMFVANFLGKANLLPGRVEADSTFVADAGISVRCDTSAWKPGARAVLCLRPENVEVGAAVQADPRVNSFAGQCVQRTYLGSTTEYVVRLSGGAEITATAPNRLTGGAHGESPIDGSGTCAVNWDVEGALLMAEK